MADKYSQEIIELVWRKGAVISGRDSNAYRKDACGATIKRIEHGNRDSVYGWEIDHINPDGSDFLSNLQPLQWENNVEKSDSGTLKCIVTS